MTVTRYFKINNLFMETRRSGPEPRRKQLEPFQELKWSEEYCKRMITSNQQFFAGLENFVRVTDPEIKEELYKYDQRKILKYQYYKSEQYKIVKSHRKQYTLAEIVKDYETNVIVYKKFWKFFQIPLNVDNVRFYELAMPCVVRNERSGELKQYFVSRIFRDRTRFLFGYDRNKVLIVIALITEWTLLPASADELQTTRRNFDMRTIYMWNPTNSMTNLDLIRTCQAFAQISQSNESSDQPKFWPTRFNIELCGKKLIKQHLPHIRYFYFWLYDKNIIKCKYRTKSGKEKDYYFSLMPKYPNYYFFYKYSNTTRESIDADIYKNF